MPKSRSIRPAIGYVRFARAALDGTNMDGIGNVQGQEARRRKALKAARAERRRAAE